MNYTVEQLEKMTRDELRTVASKLKIEGRREMKKSQLVEAIAERVVAEEQKPAEAESEKMNCAVEKKLDEPKTEEARAENKEKRTSASFLTEQKIEYIENAKPGTIVAFKTSVFGKEKVKSAAIKNISFKRRVLRLVTSYGAEYIVPYEAILWVKTTNKWPRGVYRLLKGLDEIAECGEVQR